MARKLTLVLPSATTWTAPTIALDTIPQDVKDEVEEAYTAIKANPSARIHAEFDTVEEMNLFLRQVQSYCAQRIVGGKPAPIRYRKSPTKNLGKTEVDYKVTDLKTDNEKTTEEINTAVDAVKEAATNGAAVLDPATKDAVKDALPTPRKAATKK